MLVLVLVFMFGICCVIKGHKSLCVNICIITHSVLLSVPLIHCEFTRLFLLSGSKQSLSLLLIITSCQYDQIHCQHLAKSSLTSLCPSPVCSRPASLCPPLLFFSGHCIYDVSKRTKALFCYWSGSFWFGLTARTIIGTGGALQCTFHTALAKSCKRDWFREVWHQSWLHDMKSY